MVAPSRNSNRPAGISRSLTFLFAVVGGAGVGNLYWAQPLLGDIASDLNAGQGSAGLLVSLTQVGYAIGVFFVVPLGDTMNRKRLIPAIMISCALALAGCVFAPSFSSLLTCLAFVGFTNVAGQMLLPLAGDLATDGQRARALSTVASGLLTGVLLSRPVSGMVADLYGWRSIYVLAAVMILILAIIMRKAIPDLPPRARIPYFRLLRSVVAVGIKHRPARVLPIFGASLMCVFTAFWTGLAFLLAGGPFHLSASQIGLVSLLGILGVVGAKFTGRVFDRGWPVPALGVGMCMTLLSFAISGFGGSSPVAMIIAIVLLSVGAQSALVLLQTMMVSIQPSARSRLNTAHIVSNFIGGATGSALAGALWQIGKWPAVMCCSAVVIVSALILWLIQRNRALSAYSNAGRSTAKPAVHRARGDRIKGM